MPAEPGTPEPSHSDAGVLRMTYLYGGGVHHDSPRQKWHALCLLSHFEHRGVNCPVAHFSSGIRSAAKQKSQNLPVFSPQSTQGLQSISASPTARTSNWRVSSFSMAPS